MLTRFSFSDTVERGKTHAKTHGFSKHIVSCAWYSGIFKCRKVIFVLKIWAAYIPPAQTTDCVFDSVVVAVCAGRPKF